MKDLRILKPTFFGLMLLAFTACDTESLNDETPDNLTEEEIVALVEGALISDTEGISKETEDAILETEEAMKGDPNNNCGLSSDSTVVRNYNGSRITSNYTVQWDWQLTCTDLGVPDVFNFNRITIGNYETLRMLSADNASSNWQVTNLITGTEYVLSGEYERNGSQESKVRLQNSFESTISINVSNLSVDKESFAITAGNGDYEISGTGTGGSSFTYQGTISWLSPGVVEITVNGNTYQIDLN